MTSYLRISGLCFSFAVVVSLLCFAAAFAQESGGQTTVDKVQSSEKQVEPKTNQETNTQRYKKAKEKSSTKGKQAKDKLNTAPQDNAGDLDSDNDGIPDNAKEAIAPGDGQQDRAKNVVKFKAGQDTTVGDRRIQADPEPVEAKTVKGSKPNADNSQVQPMPEPAEATTVKSSKSNSSERQTQPDPEPVEAKTIKGSKSNTSERQIQPNPEPAEATSVKSSEDSGGDLKRGTASQKPGKCGNIRVGKGDRSSGAKGDSSTCGGMCEGLGETCIQDGANEPCYCLQTQ